MLSRCRLRHRASFPCRAGAELGKRVCSLDLAPDLPPHPLLQSLQGIRLEATIDAGIQRLADNLGLDGLAESTTPRWERGRPPYPGLAAMEVDDAGVFFGRDEEVRSLVARVDAPLGQPGGNLLVVMGPSGAGKSSLVRAGLVARLAAPRSGWAIAGPFEPGTRPLGRLVSRLAALVPGQLTDGECRDRLLNEGLGAVAEWLADHMEFPVKRLLIALACPLTSLLRVVGPSCFRFAVLPDVVTGGWAAVLRSRRPSGAGLAGFRRAGRAGGRRAEVPESPADPRGGEPGGRGRAFPGAAQVGGERAGQPELGVAGDDQPGPAVGGMRVADLGGGPAECLFEQ